MKFKLNEIPKPLLKSIKEDCIWDIVGKGILEIENIPTTGGGDYYPDFKKLMEYKINPLNNILVMRNVSPEDQEILVGYTLFITNGNNDCIFPEDQYDSIPESIGNKYGIHDIDLSDQL